MSKRIQLIKKIRGYRNREASISLYQELARLNRKAIKVGDFSHIPTQALPAFFESLGRRNKLN